MNLKSPNKQRAAFLFGLYDTPEDVENNIGCGTSEESWLKQCGGKSSVVKKLPELHMLQLVTQRHWRDRERGRESELSQHAALKHFKLKQSACFYLTGRCFRVSASSSGQFVQLCDCDLSWSLFVGKYTLIWTALSIETHNIRKTL